MSIFSVPGRELEIRGLRKKEIKKLKKLGYKNTRFDPDAAADFDDAVEKILELVLDKDDLAALEDLEPKYSNEVWLAIIEATYGSGPQEKN